MAQLLVRNLDDSVKERLRRVAAAHGNSMEEEARLILHKALLSEPSPQATPPHVGLGSRIHTLFADVDIPDEFFTALDEIRQGSDTIITTPRAANLDE